MSAAAKPFLDAGSVLSICKGADQAMVYGWSHCKYGEVEDALKLMGKQEDFPIKKVFSCRIAVKSSPEAITSTLEGRNMALLPFDEKLTYSLYLSRMCKTALTDLVLENYKRSKEKKPLIPVLFCIDIDRNPRPFSIEKMTSRAERLNRQTTHKELRRAYKLCNHEDPEIRQVARETFKFVRLKKAQKTKYALEAIPSPFDSPEFARRWSNRKARSAPSKKPDALSWRKQLAKQIAEYDAGASAAKDRDDGKATERPTPVDRDDEKLHTKVAT
jgi:hypothetical protein